MRLRAPSLLAHTPVAYLIKERSHKHLALKCAALPAYDGLLVTALMSAQRFARLASGRAAFARPNG